MNELIAICVQEEERIKRDSEPVVNLVTKPKFKSGKGKFAAANGASSGEGTSGTKALGPKKPWNKKVKKAGTFECFFCKRKGHMKKNCQGFKDWLAKKGKSKLDLFSIEVNFVDNSPSTWWLDSGSPIHIANTLQGFLSKRAPKRSEANVSVGNGMGVAVKAIGTVRVVLGLGVPLIWTTFIISLL